MAPGPCAQGLLVVAPLARRAPVRQLPCVHPVLDGCGAHPGLARGGAQGGNGGLVETSGKVNLSIADSAYVSVAAPYGNGGTWLLDPTTLRIVASGGTSGSVGGANGASGWARRNCTSRSRRSSRRLPCSTMKPGGCEGRERVDMSRDGAVEEKPGSAAARATAPAV